MKNEQKTIALLVIIMAIVAMVSGGISLLMLYREAYTQKMNELLAAVQHQATLIEAVAKHEHGLTVQYKEQGYANMTMSQIRAAFSQMDIATPGEEWLLAENRGNSVHYLLAVDNQGTHDAPDVPLKGAKAPGMQLALQGQSGVQLFPDYLGRPCLVAYAPVPSLGAGLVNKMELAAFRAPFLRSAVVSAGIGLVIISLGTVLFMQLGYGITRRLQQSERRLSNLLQNSPVGVFETDAQGNCTYVTERWSQITGIGVKEALGADWSRSLHPDDQARIRQEWQQAVQSGTAFQSECRFLGSRQEAVWVYGQATPFHDIHGRIIGYGGSITDITERKQAESALLESRADLSQAQHIAHIGNWAWDLVSNKMSWSDETYRLLGCQPQVIASSYDTFLGMIHPEDRESVKKAMDQALSGSQPYELDYRILRPDNSIVHVHALGEITRDSAGTPVKMLGTLHDVSRLRQYEKELKQLNESLEKHVASRTQELQEERNFIFTILDTVGALVVVLDENGNVLRFNRACESTSGYSLKEVQNQPLWDKLLPPEQAAAFQKYFGPDAPRLPQHLENEWLAKSGRRRLISWTHSALRDQHGANLTIATGVDITNIRSTEQALLQAKLDAEQASQAKSDFLSRMSHELRTPMNAILGFTQLLESDSKTPLSDEQMDNVQEVMKAGNHLLDLINEVLDLTRIETGRITCVVAPTYLFQVIQEANRLIIPEAQQCNITLIGKIATCEHIFVMADQTRLRQVLLNLLSNAVKYNTPGGSILVACEELDDKVRLSITDTGNGIAPDKMDQLFLPFERLGAEHGPTNGTGIGLALSKQLMELMGGRIGAASTLGNGSTFWIELQKAPAHQVRQAMTKDKADGLNNAKIKILYVEDNPANLKLVNTILSRLPGFAVYSAADAETGLEIVKQRQPDIILLDINLPGMDGYQALAELRASPDTSNIPIIAVTADAMPHDVEQGMEAGFFAYLTKPLEIHELLATISLAMKK